MKALKAKLFYYKKMFITRTCMSKLLLIALLCFSLMATDKMQTLMQSISDKAIRIGYGPDTIYAFMDPMCSKSKIMLSKIDKSKYLKKKRSYYIFLYRLQKFESDSLIQYIYQSEEPIETLKEIMIYNDLPDLEDFQASKESKKIQKSIAKVAKQMDMKRRPYLLIYVQGAQYCLVSEGTAPCLEDEDF